MRSLRCLRVEFREGTGGALVAEGELQPEGARGAVPLPLPSVMDAPSVWDRLATFVSFERTMAAELVGTRDYA